MLSLLIAALVGACFNDGAEVDDPAPRRSAAPTASATTWGPLSRKDIGSALRGGGFVLYMRHSATDPVPDDSDPVVLSDCDTQRMLSEVGRRQARAIGQAIERLDIPVGRVLSSPFCRALDTARLAFGRATREPALENLETAETEEVADARTRALRHLLSTPVDAAANDVLVAHGFNITSAAGITIEEGEIAVFRPIGEADFALVAEIEPDEWERFSG
jgi:phosphohistidine phosphatase SixA